MSTRDDKRINNREPLRIWFWSLIGILFLCLFSYGYLVHGAIVDIVKRQSMETNISLLNSRVLGLESEYIKINNNITPALAQSLGFVAISNQKFVTRDITNPGLSLVTPGQ